jgi:hypothetical protein
LFNINKRLQSQNQSKCCVPRNYLKNLNPGSKNVIQQNLVDPKEVLLPSLHIKLGLMKQFVKALDKTGDCFRYVNEVFPHLSEGKIKEGVFVGPNIKYQIYLRKK